MGWIKDFASLCYFLGDDLGDDFVLGHRQKMAGHQGFR